jgi:hypothetical protein
MVCAARRVHRLARAFVRADRQTQTPPPYHNVQIQLARPLSQAPPMRMAAPSDLLAASAAQPLAGRELDLSDFICSTEPPEHYGVPRPATPFETNRRVLGFARLHADPEPGIRAHAKRLPDVKESISTPPLLSTVRQTRGLAALVAMSLLAPPFPKCSYLRKREAPSVEGRERARWRTRPTHIRLRNQLASNPAARRAKSRPRPVAT